VLDDAKIGDAGFEMIANSVTQLQRLALIECDITPAQITEQLALPALPLLEQLAYIEGSVTREERDAVTRQMLSLRPSLQLAAVPGRHALAAGFVGVYRYTG
jgi:hypothetical protein